MKTYFICFYERENANSKWQSVSTEEWPEEDVRGRFMEVCSASFHTANDLKIEWQESSDFGKTTKVIGRFQIPAL